MRQYIPEAELRKLRTFLKGGGKRLLFYHQDADGVCSAALFLKFFPDMEAEVREGPRMEEGFVESIIEQKPDVVIFIDLPVDQEWQKMNMLRKALPRAHIAVIDHHIVERNLNRMGILHINPKMVEDVYIPASALAYEIMERLGKNVEPLIWIAGMGVIGDYGFRECAGLLNRCRVLFPELIVKNPLESKLGRGAEIISSAVTLRGLRGAKKALDVMLGAEDYYAFAGNRKLEEWDTRVRGEIDSILKDFQKAKEEYPKVGLTMYEITSKLNVSSVIASILSRLYPEDVVLIRKKSSGGWKLSIRMQTGAVNVGELTKRCVKGIGSGGGHKKAAGALVSDWELFRKRFIRSLGKAQ